MKKQRLTKSVTWVSLILAMSVTEAFAGPRDHDGGFFLRLSAGLGAAQSEFEDPDLKVSGLTGDFDFAIGGVVSPNLAVHGTIFWWSATNPNVEENGSSIELDGSATVSSFGGGVTYYFMPANLYVSGSVGLAQLYVETTRGVGETDFGPAFGITLGKEWWIGNSWGLGVAGAAGYHSISEKDRDENWSGFNLAVRFTATLN